MADWFTVERIDRDTWAISEYAHPEQTHCYLLEGSACALLIDTGLGVCDIQEKVRALTALPVQVVTTHVHWDHIGGHSLFGRDSIAVFEAEQAWLSGAFPLPLPAVKAALLSESCVFPADFDPDAYMIYQDGARTILHDGDTLDLGGRKIRVIHTPGHSPGHICLYETARQYLFTGDLIYEGCLFAFYPTTDPLLYAQSVQKLRDLQVQRLCPGHHRLDISPGLVEEVCEAFAALRARGLLHHGSGTHAFGAFYIRL